VTTVFGLGVFLDRSATEVPGAPAVPPLQSQLDRDAPTAPVRDLAQWAVRSRDPGGLPFLIIDKQRARLFAFDREGRLQASAPVLLGAARGDAAVVPATPAGRFVAMVRPDRPGLVWTDGHHLLTLHSPDSPLQPGRAAERLASSEPAEKRISDGSLYVEPGFYRDYLDPMRAEGSVAYVLPEDLPLEQVFGAREGSDGPGTVAQADPHRRPS